jgi:hypothetical protein
LAVEGEKKEKKQKKRKRPGCVYSARGGAQIASGKRGRLGLPDIMFGEISEVSSLEAMQYRWK